MNNYKLNLFNKALLLEQALNSAKTQKEKKRLLYKFGNVADELYANGWRNEYDLWVQGLME